MDVMNILMKAMRCGFTTEKNFVLLVPMRKNGSANVDVLKTRTLSNAMNVQEHDYKI